MKLGVYIPNFGPFGSARVLADLAAEAEEAGWDGVFIWDHVHRHEGDFELAEPWIALAAMAMVTSKVVLGPLITPLPRRRPWNVAKSITTLDHLSGGRMVLGVGIGGSEGKEISAFGEEPDARRRGDMLDEALAVIEDMWSGEPVHHAGEHYQVDGVRFLPRPPRSGRVPIWAATRSIRGRVVRRAARLDGVFPLGIEPDELPGLVEALGHPSPSFDIVIAAGDDPGPWLATAATWWLCRLPWDQPLEVSRRMVAAGPPR
jgi:alkanesulfonate monooxygenase SsuD/methylene tetrahydromethanopterin reductase-like flavin-dependent oxidoreductase (luciferase family)